MTYDKEEDILMLSRGRAVQASIEIGDFVVDVDTKGFIVGLEILDASKTLSIPKRRLMRLQNATMTINYKQQYTLLTVFLELSDTNKEITIPLTLDLSHTTGRQRVCFARA